MIRLKNVSKFYTSDKIITQALRRIDVELNMGEFIAVTGESGSGKSTFLNVISGIDTYEEGEMFVADKETSHYSLSEWESYRQKYVSFIFQDYNLIDSFSVFQNVEIALLNRFPNKKERKQKTEDILAKVGLLSHKKHKATKLSGGQKQRAVIARALAKDSPIILADEPTGNLDSKTGKEIMQLLKEVSKDKLVVIVTHDYEDIEDFATRKIRFYDGQIAEDKKIKEAEILPDIDVVLPKNEKNKLGATLKVAVKANTVAALNYVNTPKKTIFMSVGFFIIAVLIFYIYGGMIFGMFYKYNNAFTNTSIERLVVKKDGAMTEEDIKFFNSLSKIKTVMQDDIILDLEAILKVPIYGYNDTIQYYEQERVKIDSIKNLPKTEIVKGSKDLKDNEIIFSKNKNMYYGPTLINIGEMFPFSLSTGGFSQVLLENELKVVGLVESTQYIRIIYVSDELLNKIKDLKKITNVIKSAYVEFEGANYQGYKTISKSNTSEINVGMPVWNKPLPEFQNMFYAEEIKFKTGMPKGKLKITYNKDLINNIIDIKNVFQKAVIVINNQPIEFDFDNIEFVKTNIGSITMEVSAEYMTENLINKPSEQVSLFFNTLNVKFIEKTAHKLSKAGYSTFYPYGYGNGDTSEEKLIALVSNLTTIFACIVSFFILYLLSLKIINSKVKDFSILRTLGYNKNFSITAIAIEQLYNFITGFGFASLLLLIFKFVPIKGLYPIIQMISLNRYLFVLSVSVIITIGLSFRIYRRISKLTIRNAINAYKNN